MTFPDIRVNYNLRWFTANFLHIYNNEKAIGIDNDKNFSFSKAHFVVRYQKRASG